MLLQALTYSFIDGDNGAGSLWKIVFTPVGESWAPGEYWYQVFFNCRQVQKAMIKQDPGQDPGPELGQDLIKKYKQCLAS